MTQHYTRNTRAVKQYCPTCNRKTMHSVYDRRVGHCLENHAKAPKSKPDNSIRLTEAQQHDRTERMGIMTADGITEGEARRYCDSKPEIYGIMIREEEQGELI